MIKYTVRPNDNFSEISTALGFKGDKNAANLKLFAQQIEVEGFSKSFNMKAIRPGETLINMKGIYYGKEINKQN